MTGLRGESTNATRVARIAVVLTVIEAELKSSVVV
jgi:hypothetical protein